MKNDAVATALKEKCCERSDSFYWSTAMNKSLYSRILLEMRNNQFIRSTFLFYTISIPYPPLKQYVLYMHGLQDIWL